MTDVDAVLGEPQRTYEPRLGWRRWVAIAVVVAVVGTLGWFGWWLRHPDELRWGRHQAGGETAVGEALWFAVSYPARDADDRRVITLEEIAPAGVEGRGAGIDYFVCRVDVRAAGQRGVGAVGITTTSTVEELCEDLAPAAGTTMDLVRNPQQQVLVRVTPTRAGTVRITGQRIEFREGWQQATEVVGPQLRVRTRP